MKDWAISLPRFEGPLDVLLSLVRRNQLDLANLPVAEVTRQYLDYLHRAEELDVNLGAEYADLAATLIQLKSRLLLPVDPELAAREPDPRQVLVRQLLDREQVRQAAEFLGQKLAVAEATWSSPPPADDYRDFTGEDAPDGSGAMNLLEVLRLARKALATARTHQAIDTGPEAVTIEQMIDWIEERIANPASREDPDACAWLEQMDSSRRRVMLFLALLELTRSGRILLTQTCEYGQIRVSCAEATTGRDRSGRRR